MTCAITNDDEPVELIIEKTVINDDGGTAAVDDFGITTDAGASSSRASRRARPRSSTPPRRSWSPAGTYTLAEARRGRLHADRLDLHGTATADLRRRLGDRRGRRTTVTCAITNDDEPVELIIEKTVINDDGGTARSTTSASPPTPAPLIFGERRARPRPSTPPRRSGRPRAPTRSPRADVAGYTPTDWICTTGDDADPSTTAR